MTYFFETDEHAALRDQIRRFASTEIAPHANAWEEAEEFPRSLYSKAGQAGVLGVGYPAEVGGGDGDITHAIVAGDEMVLAGKSVGTVAGLGEGVTSLTIGERVVVKPPIGCGTC